ncbi:MAG: N-6 DNA methylase [Nitrospirae bacterium]|nr:N-6 DNA methylase [Nitrospirota bacterium]
MADSSKAALSDPNVIDAIARGFIEIRSNRVQYNLNHKAQYDWTDPEEWVRARTIAFLIIVKGYPANRLRTEVTVPRRTPSDHADIVLYEDDRCQAPYLVVENKAAGQTKRARSQGIEQLFGNANSLRAVLGLYDEWSEDIFFDIANYPATERTANIKGTRNTIPELYGKTPEYTFIAGGAVDIQPATGATLETKIRRSHSIIWAGGKRDPLYAFDEWSKLLFAKVVDERNTPTGMPRGFQIGTNETTAAVANRVHRLFTQGCDDDPTIFPPSTRITLPDKKICDVVKALQDISLWGTDIDTIGGAFENFFGSIFRGQLGQYFTMRQIARFTVAVLDMSHEDFVIDPSVGSGGFLLEALLQVWHGVDAKFKGQSEEQIIRNKNDFALLRVFGIEIHEILSRICKINLLLHHDGHTNIEGDRSCLDSTFIKPRLQNWHGMFSRVIGNPPFGDEVEEGDEDKLGTNRLENFEVAKGREKVQSEHVIVERSIDLLEPGGRFGLVLPDGLLNNQGDPSNCPRVRAFLATHGHIEAIVSLPDFAFRKSGAQNKTSIMFFRKFTIQEKNAFDHELELTMEKLEVAALRAKEAGEEIPDAAEEIAIGRVYRAKHFKKLRIFMAEANHIGYTPSGASSERNDLYRGTAGGRLEANQDDTIVGEWRTFHNEIDRYMGRISPDCMAAPFFEVWEAHSSHRLDPKYHLFKRNERAYTPPGWVRAVVRDVMKRRMDEVDPADQPDKRYKVMTLSQTGEIRHREAGKGKNPPEWLGMYFENGSSTWFAAKAGDVVYSSIDLWKGCIAVVPAEFDGAVVTKEFPIYEVTDARLDAEFLSFLLRSRYYQRAFRAITTGHSNRRRTQMIDFEALEICFPAERDEQRRLIERVRKARNAQREAQAMIEREMAAFSEIIDGRHDEELPEIETSEVAEE